MKENLKKSLVISSIFNFIKTFFNALFPVITFSYASRVLGVDGVGQVNFAKSIMTYFILIATLGTNYYGTREAAKVRDNPKELEKFAKEIFCINLFSTVISYVILGITIILVPKFHSYLCLVFINSISVILSGIGMEWLNQAREEYKFIAVRNICFQILSLGVMFVFVRSEKDIYRYAFITVFATYGVYLANFLHNKKYLGKDFFKDKSLDIRKHIPAIMWLFAMAVSIDLYTVLDSTMLGFICGDEAVGIYTAAIKINKIVNSLIVSIGAVLLPRLSFYVAKKDYTKLREVSYKVFHFIFMVSVPAAVGLYMLSDEIIMIFSGSKFLSAAYTMRILVPIVVVIPFSIITNLQLFIPLKKEKFILVSTGGGAITNFVCNLLLIPRFGENGAAIATVVAETVVSIICMFNLKKILNLRSVFEQYYQYWVAVIPVLVLVKFAKMLKNNIINSVIIIIILSVFLYICMLYIMKNCTIRYIVGIVHEKIINIRSKNSK